MSRHDRVWWCWWVSERPGDKGTEYVACGYSQLEMDVRRGKYRNGRVEYESGTVVGHLGPLLPRLAQDFYIAFAPNDFAGKDESHGEHKGPERLHIDVALRMGLEPPEWRDDHPADKPITSKEWTRAWRTCLRDWAWKKELSES